ncbi:MAG: DinB family protein [Phycisphaerales bacterium]
MKQAVLDTFHFQRGYLGLLVDDIPAEQMTAQPHGIPNHPAWQIGHLAGALDGVATLLGAAPVLDDAFKAKFDIGSTPTGDRGAYPSKAELLAAHDRARASLVAAFERADDAVFGKPNPGPVLSQGLPTLAPMSVFMMLTHEATHLGQISVWRQAQGMRPALEPLFKQAANA